VDRRKHKRPDKRPVAGPVVGRRRFLLASGIGAVAVAAPQVSRAQTVNWRIQSAWPPRDLFHEFALDYASKIDALTGGRLKFDVLSAGSVVPAFQISDAVHGGILDGAHGDAALRYNKHKASALFGTPPSFGWDSHGFLAWFYYGGGEALYKELLNGILNLNLVGFLYFPMPTQPLGWFRKEIGSPDDFKGVRYRTSGLSAEVFSALGAAVMLLPAGDIVPAMERGVLDATDSNNPSADLQLGLPDAAKHYMMGGHHRQVDAFEIIFNKTKFDALEPEFKVVLRQAAFSASSDQLWSVYARYAKDFDEIKKREVNVVKTSPDVLDAQLKAWDQVIAERSKEAFFAKVIASQKAWVKRTGPFLQTNNLDSSALSAAYRHFFG
jgi:TRAP-type mannitol/chloroaromatic compound transport system substrate-binding protein